MMPTSAKPPRPTTSLDRHGDETTITMVTIVTMKAYRAEANANPVAVIRRNDPVLPLASGSIVAP